MRFLFVTLQFVESDFYAEVASELTVRGHEVAMVAMSPRAAAKHRDRMPTYCMLDLVAAAGLRRPVAEEAAEIESQYSLPTLRDAYRTDRACFGRSESWSLDWAVRHFRAMEKIFDAESPDVVFLDVGGEVLRTAAHEVARARGVTVLFPFYTIFPRPLRLHANTMQGPIVTREEIRPLRPEERGEVETFIAEFTERAQPIREYRRSPSLRTHWRNLVRHVVIKLTKDRDNPY